MKKYKKLLIAAVVFVILLGFDLSPFGGNGAFYSKWTSCGHRPVAAVGAGHFGTGVPHYIEPASFELIRNGQPDYYCTPLEAENAGYSSNPNRYEYRYRQSYE